MLPLIVAVIAFVGTHLLMSHPLRGVMVRGMGQGGFMIAYSLVSIGTFAWMYLAYRAAPGGPVLFVAPEWTWTLVSIAMLFASILLAGSFFSNPALPTPDAARSATYAPWGVYAITRHPMMWAIMIWAICHLLLMPSPADLWLVGGLFFLAFAGSIGQDRKKAKTMGLSWQNWRNKTSFYPFALLISRGNWGSAVPKPGVLLLGVAIWVAATWLHTLLGAPAAGMFRWI